MSLSDFKMAVAFLQKSGLNNIKLLGGEPTLHRNFREIVIYAEAQPEKLTIFTHGGLPGELVDFLYTRNIHYVLNYSANQATENRSRFIYFLKKLGTQTTLGINYDHQFTEDIFREIIELTKTWHLKKKIRFGITTPVYHFKNDYFDFFKYKEKLNRDLHFIGGALAADNLGLHFDCGCMPVCCIEDETISFLKKYCNADIYLICSQPDDLLPGNRVIRCFPLSIFSKQVNDFENIEAINQYFGLLDDFLFQHVKPEMCLECEFESKTCQSACWAYRVALLSPFPENEEYAFSKDFLYKKNQTSTVMINKTNLTQRYTFEDTGKAIIDRLISGKGRRETVNALAAEYSAERYQLEQDIDQFIDGLKQAGLLRTKDRGK